MYYEINVAKKDNHGGYSHYFATSPRSISTIKSLEEKVKDFGERFPYPEFDISVSKVEQSGIQVDFKSFLDNPDIFNK